jgi:guanylate kinase
MVLVPKAIALAEAAPQTEFHAALCYNVAVNTSTERTPDTNAWEAEGTGLLLVVSGPSAVGKDTVLDALLSRPDLPRPVQKCVTTTTRAPRPKEGGSGMEVDGVDYHFVTPAHFNEMVAQDELLEYAEYADNYYGTPRAWVAERRTQGIDVILKIEVQGGLIVREKAADAVLIFLQPPSLEELERRLRHRRTDSEDQIAKRLLHARKEMAQRPHYDYAVTNENVEEAVGAIRAILSAEHCRIHKGHTEGAL